VNQNVRTIAGTAKLRYCEADGPAVVYQICQPMKADYRTYEADELISPINSLTLTVKLGNLGSGDTVRSLDA
jgi:hypothetical protein